MHFLSKKNDVGVISTESHYRIKYNRTKCYTAESTNLLVKQVPTYLVILRRIRRPAQVILLVPTAPIGVKL